MVQRPTLSSILAEKGLCGALFVMGEVMFITRPLIYVLLIRKYGIRSWLPWCISLAVDLTGMGILSSVTMLKLGRKDQQLHLSDQEKDEVRVLGNYSILRILMHFQGVKFGATFIFLGPSPALLFSPYLWAIKVFQSRFGV